MSRKQPKCADLWSPWEFKRRSKRSGERPRSARDCVSACNFGSDAYLMTALRITRCRAIVLREGQFSRAHTFAV
jgi:hypothetical protein